MKYELGSNLNIADPPLSLKKRESILKSVREKHTKMAVTEQPQQQPAETHLPLPSQSAVYACIDCKQRKVLKENDVCVICSTSEPNPRFSPALVIGLTIAFGIFVVWFFDQVLKN